jgi:hypothetical protein
MRERERRGRGSRSLLPGSPIRLTAAILTGVIAVGILIGQPAFGAERRAASGPLTGTWSGKYGGTYHGTFVLHWTQSGSKLSGTIKLSTQGSKLNLSGTVKASAIRFGTVGSAAITYSGSVSGKSMSGSYHTPGGGGSWSAHKTS